MADLPLMALIISNKFYARFFGQMILEVISRFLTQTVSPRVFIAFNDRNKKQCRSRKSPTKFVKYKTTTPIRGSISRQVLSPAVFRPDAN